MKNFSLVLSAMVLFAGVSFAQQKPDPDPAHGVHTSSNNTNKSSKKASAKKSDSKTSKTAANKASK